MIAPACGRLLAEGDPMTRHFNTGGPCRLEKHYMLPAAERLSDARRLIDLERYFVLHAPGRPARAADRQEHDRRPGGQPQRGRAVHGAPDQRGAGRAGPGQEGQGRGRKGRAGSTD
ncbi:MAG: hypothetical protein GY842_02645 [bacterium]|nr:hypothetical protein [bacterium]